MAFNRENYQSVLEEFTIDGPRLHEIAANFRQDLTLGLKSPEDSSLRMLKSYVGLPTGKETGEYLALDFGGTNVRVLRIRLEGAGNYEIVKRVGKPLRLEGSYDYVGPNSKAEEMFDFLAELIDEAVEGNHERKYLLGHTFSFPSEQTDLYNAKLIIWTKEFATAGVEGKVVNDLLKDALARKGLTNVEPVAVINDTVAVLLSAAYKQEDVYIGSIYATGHNTCYLEQYADSAQDPMILNLESGGFSKLMPNSFDKMLDDASEKPGEQRLEKMASGRYMGDLFGMALSRLWGDSRWDYGFTSIDMSGIISDESEELKEVLAILSQRTGRTPDLEELRDIRELAKRILDRSARLVTATFAGIIWQLAGKGKVHHQHIAVDGSVYEKMPGAKENIMRALSELLGEDGAEVDTILDNGGSGLGAAIAAAMSQK